MSRFQLRISNGQRFVNLFDSMIRKAWHNAEKHFDARNVLAEDFSDFAAETQRTLRPYVSTYDLCGSAVACSDDVEGAPWLDYDDRVYHLLFPGTFSEFLGELSYAAFRSVRHLAKPGLEQALYGAIENSFRHELGDHLYYNPACGRIELCSFSHHRDPWEN